MRLDQGVIDLLNYSFISRVKDTSLKANLRPAVDSTYNLGSNERRFNYVYADNIVASTFLGDVSGNADTVDSYHAYDTPTANGLLALDSSLHFPSTVYHEALLVDGTRSLTGNLAVSAGVTIDGIDISAHAADGDIHADHTTIIITAGAGLTGGGDITTSRTLDVGAGDGLTVSADAIALTTPGTLTTASDNSSAGNHTHLIQSSSNVWSPGGISYFLKASTLGYLGLARLGIGFSNTPSYPLHIRSTESQQFRLEYDATNYASLSVGAGGGLTITSYQDMALTPLGGDLIVNAQLGIGLTPSYALHVQDTVAQVFMQYDATNYTYLEVTSSGNFYVNSIGNQVFKGITADSDTSFYFQANNNCFLQPTANLDNSGPGQAGFILRDYVTNHWGLWKSGSGNLHIFDYSNSTYLLNVTPSGNALWTPTGILEIRKGGEQLRLAYDGTYYTQFTVNSSGVLTIDAVGDAVVLQTNNKIGSVDFTSQLEGWEMTYAGNLDCRYIYADELRVKAFTAEIYSALVGALIITKSRARLSRDFRIGIGYTSITGVNQTDDYFSISGDFYTNGAIQAGDFVRVINSTGNDNTYSVDNVAYDSGNNETDIYVTIAIPSAVVDGTIYTRMQMYVEDLEELEDTAVFDAAGGDWVLLRHIDMSGGGLIVSNIWCRAWTYNAEGTGDGEQSWLMHIVDAGVNNASAGGYVYSGAIALDYGQSGDGTWEATVLDQGNSPYSQVTTWTTDPSIPANHTVWTRTGNLDGIGTLTEQYGIWMGQGTDEGNDAQIIMSNVGARILNLDLFIKSSGTTKVIASSSGYLSAGNVAPTTFGSGAGFWAGWDGGTAYQVMIGNTAGNWLSYDSSNGYLDIKYGANTYGRWNLGTITLGLATGSGGRAVLSSTGIYLYGNNQNTVQIQSGGDVILGLTSTGHLLWDYSNSTLYLKAGTNEIISLPSSGSADIVGTLTVSGSITAGSVVTLNSSGIQIALTSGFNDNRSIKYMQGSSLVGALDGYDTSTNTTMRLRTVVLGTTRTASVYVTSVAYSGKASRAYLQATSAQTCEIQCYVAGLGTRAITTQSDTFTMALTSYLTVAGYMQVSGGVRAGSNADPGDGNVSVQYDVTAGGDGRFGGGLYVGSTGVNPATGAIRATGNASIAGGLYVGSSSTTTSTGYVEASSHVVANGNFFGRSSDHYFKTSVNIGYSSDVDSNRFKLLNESVNYRIEKAYAGTCSLWINYVGNGAGTRVVRISNGNGGYGNIHADNFVNESRRDSKRNIRSFKTDIPSALDVVDQINVVAFEKPNSGSRSNKRRIGMIAEELYEVLPEVVATEYDTGAPEGIDYSQLVPVLIEAIKELKEEVRRLS